MQRLFIAEKPSMAESIAKVLGGARKQGGFFQCGNGDVVTWCFGHLMEQAPPESYDERVKVWALDYLPVVPDKWRKYVKPDAKTQFELIRKLVGEASTVVNAGDPDREGNLLVDEVLDSVGCKCQTQRIWLLGLDETNVKKALGALRPNSEYRGFTDAAEGRGRADWSIGMNLTMGFTVGWQSRGNTGTLHVGRVQTPTLWMVVTRDREIENFKPVDYFVARFKFMHPNGAFWVTWMPRGDRAGIDADGRVIDRRLADDLVRAIGGASGIVAKLEKKTHTIQAPLPFSLAELQKAANKAFGYSPDQVLKVCQSLYETHKMTTYPRSDCGYLPESQHADAAAVMEAVKGAMGSAFRFQGDLDLGRKSAAWDDKKVGAHHGIIPTANRGNYSALRDDEKNIYFLVVRNYLAQFALPFVYEGTSVVIEAGDEREKFAANGKVDKRLGWRTLFGAEENADGESEGDGSQKLPDMAQGDAGSMSDGKVDAKKTTPPPAYNGASLIDAMENAHRFIEDEGVKKRLKKSKGIGTEATRAGIVAQLVKRGYIDEVGKGKKSFYRSSDKGRALIDALPDAIKRPDLTAYFEDLLHQVQEGEMSLDDFTSKQSKFVARLVDEIRSGEALVNMPTGMATGRDGAVAPSQPCLEPGCSGTMKRRQRKGKKEFFWVCEHDHFADDNKGKPVPRAARASVETVAEKCPACGGDLVVRSSKRGKFLGCTSYPRCNYAGEYKG